MATRTEIRSNPSGFIVKDNYDSTFIEYDKADDITNPIVIVRTCLEHIDPSKRDILKYCEEFEKGVTINGKYCDYVVIQTAFLPYPLDEEGKTVEAILDTSIDLRNKIMAERKFYKTVYKIEVLSEEPMGYCESLSNIEYEITEGQCSGIFTEEEIIELTPQEMVVELESQGSDPEFFRLDKEGNDLE